MQRFGMALGLKREHADVYRKYHAAVWPEVLEAISASHIRNYSIYLKDDMLFAYFEYHGEDFKKDMQKMADHPKTQEWWAIMQPMQTPLPGRKESEWWADMEEVFHLD